MKMFCSFCGAGTDSRKLVISAPIEYPVHALICNECVFVSVAILRDAGILVPRCDGGL